MILLKLLALVLFALAVWTFLSWSIYGLLIAIRDKRERDDVRR